MFLAVGGFYCVWLTCLSNCLAISTLQGVGEEGSNYLDLIKQIHANLKLTLGQSHQIRSPGPEILRSFSILPIIVLSTPYILHYTIPRKSKQIPLRRWGIGSAKQIPKVFYDEDCWWRSSGQESMWFSRIDRSACRAISSRVQLPCPSTGLISRWLKGGPISNWNLIEKGISLFKSI